MEASSAVPQSNAALEAQITELAGHLNSANHRLLVLIAEFDRRKGWADSATQSCAHWLNWKCGIDLGAAREKVRVALALESLPRVSAAMARGELSYSKVRAITRVARPETEEVLLSIALHGTAHHVETTVRCFRRAQQAEELSRECRQQAARRVSYSYDDDGSLILKASLPAETGALLVKALDAAIDAMEAQEREALKRRKRDASERQNKSGSAEHKADADTRQRRESGAERREGTERGKAEGGRWPEEFSAETTAGVEQPAPGRRLEHVSAETSAGADDPAASERREHVFAETSAGAEDPTPGERPTRSVRRADALARIAESFLAHGAEVLASGDRAQLIVHVDAETLREGGAGRCEHEDGPSMPVETARRLACDASVVHIHEGEDGEPLSVGRKTRTIPSPIRRALNSRDRGCRFPGCPNRHYVDGHHIHHWANGGDTSLSNLVLLCRFHHRQVHEGGVAVERLDDGALRFMTKQGRAFDSPRPARPGDEPHSPPPDAQQGDWTTLFSTHDANSIAITPETAATRWRGESMDYGIAVEALLHRTRHAQRFRGNA